MKKYYELLGVTPFSNISEIKHAFRKKAKSAHPDLKGSESETANIEMTQLIEAYRFLIDKHKNFVEINVFKSRKVKEFNYRSWLAEREDYESRAKLIVFDLFHHREKDAVEEYLRLLELDLPFNFSRYFSRYDYMDYGFVLAEELFFEKHYYESFMILKDIFVLEDEKPYFTHFFPEVIKLTKTCLNRLKTSKNYHRVFECYTIATKLNFPPKQKAVFSKHLEKMYEFKTFH